MAFVINWMTHSIPKIEFFLTCSFSEGQGAERTGVISESPAAGLTVFAGIK